MKNISKEEFLETIIGKKQSVEKPLFVEEEIIDFISALPTVYGDELDRIKMWEKIHNSLLSACKKCNGNAALMCNMIFESICADVNKLVSNTKIGSFINSCKRNYDEHIINHIEENIYNLIYEARALYKSTKPARGSN